MKMTIAHVNGRLLERLRQHGRLAVGQSTAEEELQLLLDLPVSRQQFWRSVAELEQTRELTIAPDGLTYRDSADRW